MYNIRKIDDDLTFVGVNDRRLTLFENVHPLPEGVSYNSYLLKDEKTVLFDTVDWSCGRQFFENVEAALDGRDLDFVVVHHAEPDHAATLDEILMRYPNARVLCSAKAKTFLEQFGHHIADRVDTVKNGDTVSFGKHELTFISAPMVHWPEVLVSFDTTTGTLFSADAFGSFKTLDGVLFEDEINGAEEIAWLNEARRYYTNIVGKYGKNVQMLLKKASGLDIKMICPLHGVIWRQDIDRFIEKYDLWSRYEPEHLGVVIACGSMYGNTEQAADILANALVQRGVKRVRFFDVSKTHPSYVIASIFRYSHLVVASPTYNLGIYPTVHNLIDDMKNLHIQNRTISIIENGSWAPKSGSLIAKELEGLDNITYLGDPITVKSSVNDETRESLIALAQAIADDIYAKKNK